MPDSSFPKTTHRSNSSIPVRREESLLSLMLAAYRSPPPPKNQNLDIDAEPMVGTTQHQQFAAILDDVLRLLDEDDILG